MDTVDLPSVLVFEWDKGNELKSYLKHSITTIEAEEPFFSKDRIFLNDKRHSLSWEIRTILIGKTKVGKVLFIVFTIRGTKIRIISARKADRKEVQFYEKATKTAKV